jgi:phosphoglycolate phosphatase-like HAD superfamily hydrolase
MGMRPSVVMFDLDGTLIDTMGGFADLASELIHTHYDDVSVAQARTRYLETSGIPFRQQLEVIFPGDDRNDEVAATYEGRKPEITRDARLDRDATWMLRRLHEMGTRVVISSNSAQRFVDEFQRDAPLTFDLALGYGDGLAKGRPHVELVCCSFNVNPHEILFVGDSLKDGELAQRCGQRFVGRTGTFHRNDFTAEFPDAAVIDRISDLRYLVLPCK